MADIDPLVIDKDGKPHWRGSKEALAAERDRTERSLHTLQRQTDALDALMGDTIAIAMLEIPESPAMAIMKVMMQTGLHPDDIDTFTQQENRRGFLWPK
jgi:hypothetical protein